MPNMWNWVRNSRALVLWMCIFKDMSAEYLSMNRWELKVIWRRLDISTTWRGCREMTTGIIASLIYRIWKTRNTALWELKIARSQVITDQTKQKCRLRKDSFLYRKLNQRQKEWIEDLLKWIVVILMYIKQ